TRSYGDWSSDVCSSDLALARLAWHLGDRHVAVQILPNRLRMRREDGVETLLKNLGARVAAIEAPFDPEGGAYMVGHGDRDHHHRSEERRVGKECRAGLS